MSNSTISDSVIKRLPRYYRFLGELKAGGMTRISSRELSERMGLTASQIRQDLNCFGGFGQQGYGYNIELLQSEIGHILGLDAPKTAILIGIGNLGRAVTMHVNFETKEVVLFGKGNKHRTSYLNARAELALKNYLDSRDDDNDALFVSDRKPHNRLSKFGIEKRIGQLGE